MVVDRGGQVGLHHLSLFADRESGTILEISLEQHHPVGLAVTSGRAFPGFAVDIQMCPAKPLVVKVPLQGGTLQSPRRDTPFQFQDSDELVNGP